MRSQKCYRQMRGPRRVPTILFTNYLNFLHFSFLTEQDQFYLKESVLPAAMKGIKSRLTEQSKSLTSMAYLQASRTFQTSRLLAGVLACVGKHDGTPPLAYVAHTEKHVQISNEAFDPV